MSEQETLRASPKATRFAYVLNAKRAKKDAEIAAAVEAYRREMEEREHAAPTPERMRKGDVRRVVVKGEGIRYRPRQDVVKRYSTKWRPEAEVAFMQLAADAVAGEVTGITINYHQAGSGRSAGDRMGGLGNAHVKKIEAFNRFTEVMETLPPRLQSVTRWLILGEAFDGRVVTLEDVGRYLFSHMTDKRSCEMLGLGAVVAIGDLLVSAYWRYNIGHRFREARLVTKEVRP